MQALNIEQTSEVLRMMLAGNSTLTFKNEESGSRMTFKVVKSKPNPKFSKQVWFVKFMYGPDNNEDFTFIGTIFQNGETTFKHSLKSRFNQESKPVVTFSYLLDHFARGIMPGKLGIYHEGRCCRCGRKLTVPESILSGIGPECAGKML